MFKKILFLAVGALFAFGAIAQAGEIKASNLPLDTLTQNFGGYADKESKKVITKDRQELIKYATMSSMWMTS